MIRWTFDLTVKDFVRKAKKNVQIVWFGRYLPIKDTVALFELTNTRVRRGHIDNWHNWRLFTGVCYTLVAADWKYKDQKKVLLQDANLNPEWFGKLERSRFEPTLFSLYDVNKHKHLLIDGTKRALALTRHDSIALSMRYKGKGLRKFAPVEIWECYGRNLDPIFPCDLHQL